MKWGKKRCWDDNVARKPNAGKKKMKRICYLFETYRERWWLAKKKTLREEKGWDGVLFVRYRNMKDNGGQGGYGVYLQIGKKFAQVLT